MTADARSQMDTAVSVASSMAASSMAAALDAANASNMQGALAGSAMPAIGVSQDAVESAVPQRAVANVDADIDALSGFMQTIATDVAAQSSSGSVIAERSATVVAATDSSTAGARKDPSANAAATAGSTGGMADVVRDASAGRGDSAASNGDGNTGGGQQRDERLTSAAASARAGQALDALANAVSPEAFLEGDAQPLANAGSALSARLAEVESSLSRERVAKSIEQGLLEIEAGPNQGAASAANGAATIASAAAGAMGVPGESIEFLANAAGGALGGDPAQDLARPLADPLPTGRLAAKGLDILSNHRGGAITMRLEPPALGQLRIELRVSHGAVVADFTAATAEARVLLEANLGMLRERLESQGLTVERMSVHGGGRGAEAAPVAQPQTGDMRQDSNNNGSNNNGSDARDRDGGRQDAAGGESRGRRDGHEEGRDRDARGDRPERGAFGGILESQRGQTEPRTLRTAV
jgi:flagellar hook-length control protein FliK